MTEHTDRIIGGERPDGAYPPTDNDPDMFAEFQWARHMFLHDTGHHGGWCPVSCIYPWAGQFVPFARLSAGGTAASEHPHMRDGMCLNGVPV